MIIHLTASNWIKSRETTMTRHILYGKRKKYNIYSNGIWWLLTHIHMEWVFTVKILSSWSFELWNLFKLRNQWKFFQSTSCLLLALIKFKMLHFVDLSIATLYSLHIFPYASISIGHDFTVNNLFSFFEWNFLVR